MSDDDKPLPFEAVKKAMPRHVEEFCRRYLGDGKKGGGWWLCRSPFREDRNPSFGVSLSTGHWKDFARPDENGDLIDLLAKLDKCTNVEAVKRLALMMRVS